MPYKDPVVAREKRRAWYKLNKVRLTREERRQYSIRKVHHSDRKKADRLVKVKRAKQSLVTQ